MKKNISEVSLHEKDTGSSEVQIAILTDKIEMLSKHVKEFKKDKHSSVGLLKYIKKNKMDAYKNVLSKLNLRK